MQNNVVTQVILENLSRSHISIFLLKKEFFKLISRMNGAFQRFVTHQKRKPSK